jgi:hypothetical protein
MSLSQDITIATRGDSIAPLSHASSWYPLAGLVFLVINVGTCLLSNPTK